MTDYLWIGLSGAMLIATLVALSYFTRPTLRYSRSANRR